ncbi:MAG: AmmeMemoRadiSam system protein B, partial [Blastocatellia bacterium]
MTAPDGIKYPRIRLVDPRPIVHEGQRLVMLRDPLQLTDKVLVVPQQLLPILALCDGSREDARALGAAFTIRYGAQADTSLIEQLLEALDSAVLLDNVRFHQMKQQVLDEYRGAEFREPSLAGPSYPANADELTALLDGYLEPAKPGHPSSSGELRGLV